MYYAQRWLALHGVANVLTFALYVLVCSKLLGDPNQEKFPRPFLAQFYHPKFVIDLRSSEKIVHTSYDTHTRSIWAVDTLGQGMSHAVLSHQTLTLASSYIKLLRPAEYASSTYQAIMALTSRLARSSMDEGDS